jgi:signal transduction histidine kinase
LFRSVRELLANVVKHARATHVVVSVERKGDCVLVAIQDNGVGCDPDEMMGRPMGFGILSIRESLERLGGRVNLESQRGEGCTITVYGPLKREANVGL